MKSTVSQIFRFGVVGTMNTAIDLFVFIGLKRNFDFFEKYYLLAALIGFLIAGINGYFFNKAWTFKDKAKITKAQMIRFYLAAGVSLVVNEAILWILIEQGLYDLVAKIAAGVSAGLINFSLQKFWTFANKRKSIEVVNDLKN